MYYTLVQCDVPHANMVSSTVPAKGRPPPLVLWTIPHIGS